LKSADRWTRQFAKRALADKPTEEVVRALNEWTANPGLPELALKEALGVYQSHESVAPTLIAKLAKAQEAGARAYAASVIGAWTDKLPNALELLRPLAADEHPRVRLQAVVAASYFTNARAMEIVAMAADFPTDKFVQYALNQTVFALKPYWLPAFRAGTLNLESKPARMAMLVRADGSSDTVEALRVLLRSDATDAAKETYWRILADVGNADDLASILRVKDNAMLARLLPVVGTASRARGLRPSGNLTEALRTIIEKQNDALRAEGLRLAGQWKLTDFAASARTLAENQKASVSVRAAAVEALGGFDNEVSLATLHRLIEGDSAPVRARAIAAFAPHDVNKAAQAAADYLAGAEDSESITTVFAAFLSRKGAAEPLANALAGKAPSTQATEAGLQLMNASGRRDELLARVLNRGVKNSQMSAAEVAAFAAEIRTNGDAKHGAEIYARPTLGCIACHAMNGQGGNIGPNLSAVGSAQPIDFIVGAILDPQKEIKEGFTSISVTTKDGEEYQGYQVRETKEELVLRDTLQNKEVRLRRASIQDKRASGSVMPSGLVDTLTREEFRDLVRFLSELGRTK
jgi:putative heme-binding domain-containing protein